MLTKLKNVFDGLISRLNIAANSYEEIISEFEDISIKNSKLKRRKKTKINRTEYLMISGHLIKL